MPVIDWPSNIPQAPMVEGYNETFPELVIRSNMETGPAKVRRRTTVNVRHVNCVFALTGAELEILDGFLNEDLAGGAFTFNFPHPRKASTIVARYVPPAVIEAWAPDGNVDEQLFKVTVPLEFLP